MGLQVRSNHKTAEGPSPTRRSGAPAPHPLLRLQQAAGNAAMAQLVNTVQRAASDGWREEPETGRIADEKTRAAALPKQQNQQNGGSNRRCCQTSARPPGCCGSRSSFSTARDLITPDSRG
jgi:hypothetical protein